jgi:hypothetical protein
VFWCAVYRISRHRFLHFTLNHHTSGDGIAIQDPDAGLLNLAWNLTLSVAAGSLTLASTAGLTGSGNGTGSLSYSGSLSAVVAALEGMSYSPPAGPHVLTTLTLSAQSYGAPPLATQLVLTDGVFVVTTTADSGPGSLRQAILDSNAATGRANTIDFDIPDPGVQTIVPLSPLPAITDSVLIDGTSQPGYAGTPLVALRGQSPGSPGPLAISGGNIAIIGLILDSIAIDATSAELLIADVHAQGLTTQLSLLDSQGQVLVHSDGLSPAKPENVIDEHLTAGVYSLRVDGTGGPGAYTWTAYLIPATPPFQPVPVGSARSAPSSIVTGDFAGDGRTDLAVANFLENTVSVLLSNGDGTFQPPVTYAGGGGPNGIVAGDFTGNGKLDLAVADYSSNSISVLLGNGDGTFQPATQYAVGTGPYAIAAGDFTGDGRLDLAVANELDGTVSVLLGDGDGTFQPAVPYAVGGLYPTAIATGDFTGDGRLGLAIADSGSSISVLLGNGDGTFQPAVQYAVGSQPDAIVAGDFTGNGHLDLAVANLTDNDYLRTAGQRRRYLPAPGHLCRGEWARCDGGGGLHWQRQARPRGR